jgi:DNA-binding MarR family transcriptional regulator
MARTATARKARKTKEEGRASDDGKANIALRALADRFPLWKRPGYLIRRLHQIHSAIFLEECAAFGITPVQYGLLTVLATNPNADQVALAYALGIDRTNVADVLRRLERRGLISRVPSRRDRRMVLARLTEEGERLVEAMHPAMAHAQDKLLDVLNRRDRDLFVLTLMRLVESNNRRGRAPLGTARED